MKSLFRILVVTSVVLLAGLGASSVMAQGETECAADGLGAWQDSTFAVLSRYRAVIQEPDSISVVATLQALRRQIENLEVPACAVTPPPDLFIGMLNLTADTVVARLNNDNDSAADLQSEADQQHKIVSDAYVGYEPPAVVLTALIDSHQDGDEVAVSEQIRGTFDPAPLPPGEFLWLFVYAPNGRYYPQVIDACADSRATITPRRNRNSWSMTAYMGAEGDVGFEFELILMVGDEAATQDLDSRFDGWCPSSFTGLTENQITELGLKELTSVVVIRK